MTAPLLGTALAGTAIFLAILLTIPMLARLEEQHRVRRPRQMIIDRYHARGLVALIEPHVSAQLARTCASIDRMLRVAAPEWGGINGTEYLSFGLIAICTGFLVGFVPAGLLIGLRAGVAFGLVVAAVAGGLWWLAISDVIKHRREDTWRQFPFFLDTLVMTMQAGATLPQALKIYVRSNPEAALARDLADALNRAEAGVDILSAIEETLERVTVEEIVVTMRAILHAERMGADRLRLLRENAADIRAKRWEQADRASEVLKTKITLPTMLIMLAVVILILSPAVVEIGKSGLF